MDSSDGVLSFRDWLKWAETIAYGPLNLKPWEFERLQPHEFNDMADGYVWRQEQQENVLAYFTCQLLNVSGKSLKKPITPLKLLEPLRTKKKKQSSKAKDEAYLRKQFSKALGGEKHDNSSRTIS